MVLEAQVSYFSDDIVAPMKHSCPDDTHFLLLSDCTSQCPISISILQPAAAIRLKTAITVAAMICLSFLFSMALTLSHLVVVYSAVNFNFLRFTSDLTSTTLPPSPFSLAGSGRFVSLFHHKPNPAEVTHTQDKEDKLGTLS